MALSQQKLLDWIVGLAFWTALGFSLGWYYTFTYAEAYRFPLPYPEAMAAFVWYTWTGLDASIEMRAIYFVALFPLAGTLWAFLITATAPFFGGRPKDLGFVMQAFGFAAIPTILAGFGLAYLAAAPDGIPDMDRLLDVGTRSVEAPMQPWIVPLFIMVSMVSSLCEIWLYRRMFQTYGRQAFTHVTLCLGLACVAAVGAGTLIARGLEVLTHWGLGAA